MVWQAMWTTFPTFCMNKMLLFLCHIILSENKELMVDVYYTSLMMPQQLRLQPLPCQFG